MRSALYEGLMVIFQGSAKVVPVSVFVLARVRLL